MEPQTRKQLIAGAIAAVLTLGSAGAAVALNLGARTDDPPSEAGRLTATSTGATPSTVVVDVPVPAPAGNDPAGTTGAPVTTVPVGVDDHGGTVDRDDRFESGDDRDDRRREEDRRDDDRHEVEGRDDDD